MRRIARSKLALAGAASACVLFPMLIVSVTVDLIGWVENPYFSFLLYLTLAPMLLIAIGLTLLGMSRTEAENSYSFESFKKRLAAPDGFQQLRQHAYLYTILASAFLFFLGVVAVASQRYSTTSSFCANFCHEVMEPAYITYKNSPHSQVPCVACHAGKNSPWLVRRQLTGLQQLYVAVTNSYSRPLKTPSNHLRPTRETCEQCHWPDKFHGLRLRLVDQFLEDEANTHVQTAMLIKIGSGGTAGRPAHDIHWHTSTDHRLFYESPDNERREITRVLLVDSDNSTESYLKPRSAVRQSRGAMHQMDCIDCHNRPTHFQLSPDSAVNDKLLTGQIPVRLPYAKKAALAAITKEYGSAEEAKRGIAAYLRGWYSANHPETAANNEKLLERAIRGTQQAYAENVFPEMKVGWYSYPDFIGHRRNSGCFRCHDGSFRSSKGDTISKDCNLCHIILAENVPVDRVMETIVKGKQR